MIRNATPSVPKVRPWKPTAKQKKTDETMSWLWGLKADDLRPYAGQWIAAHDCRIIAAAPTREELAPKIAHLDRSTVIVYRVENRVMVRYDR